MAQCPGCQKFPALNLEEPEADLGIDGSEVHVEVRVVRTSECCGEEMKEAALEASTEIPEVVVKAHEGEGHELEVEEDSIEGTERSEGKGRGLRSFYGFTLAFTVRCSCQPPDAPALFSGTLEDDIQASSMDDCC